jgi:hypothetical protein
MLTTCHRAAGHRRLHRGTRRQGPGRADRDGGVRHPYGSIEVNGQPQPVPVDVEMLRKIAELSGGEAYTASSLEQLKEVFNNLQEQIGYETIKGDASVGWLRLGAVVLALAALAALLLNRRLPNYGEAPLP